MDWKQGSAGFCLCLVMIGTGGEIVRIANALCDWHWVACTERSETQPHLHMTDITTIFTTSSG